MRTRAGQLLIATSDLGDPNFSRTVVLLVQDEPQNGSLGLVLNRPIPVSVKAAFEQEMEIACDDESPLYKGGPVEQMLTSLHTLGSEADREVLDGVYFSSRRDAIEAIVRAPQDGKEVRSRFFVGYSGWGAGQLDNEIAAGGWIVHPAKIEHIFEMTTDEQWNKLIAEVTLGKWVNPDRMPDDPTVN